MTTAVLVQPSVVVNDTVSLQFRVVSPNDLNGMLYTDMLKLPTPPATGARRLSLWGDVDTARILGGLHAEGSASAILAEEVIKATSPKEADTVKTAGLAFLIPPGALQEDAGRLLGVTVLTSPRFVVLVDQAHRLKGVCRHLVTNLLSLSFGINAREVHIEAEQTEVPAFEAIGFSHVKGALPREYRGRARLYLMTRPK